MNSFGNPYLSQSLMIMSHINALLQSFATFFRWFFCHLFQKTFQGTFLQFYAKKMNISLYFDGKPVNWSDWRRTLLLWIIGHTMDEGYSATSIVGKLSHVKQILGELLSHFAKSFVLLAAMFLILDQIMTKKKRTRDTFLVYNPLGKDSNLTTSEHGKRRMMALTGLGSQSSISGSRPRTSVTIQSLATPRVWMYLVKTYKRKRAFGVNGVKHIWNQYKPPD